MALAMAITQPFPFASLDFPSEDASKSKARPLRSLQLQGAAANQNSRAVTRRAIASNGVPEIVRKLCNQGQFREALQFFHEMEQPPDCFTYSCLLQECIKKKAFWEGKSIHAHMNKNGIVPNIILTNTLMNMYAKLGSLADARKLFDEMLHRDTCSWNTLITSYSRHGPAEEALKLFHQMQRSILRPDRFTYASVLSACAKLGALEQGIEIHQEIVRRQCQIDGFVESALVDLYAKCGSIDKARELFDRMSKRDTVLWNIMIAAYGQKGLVDEAFNLFQEMPKRNLVSWNAIITGYLQNGRVDEAQKLFRKIPKPNVVSWTAMISGYAQNGHSEEALKTFHAMQRAGVKPDIQAFASVLTACANMAALQQGMEIHKEMRRSGFESNAFMGNVLIDMYAKCGDMEKARRVFDKMPDRNVVSWTAMIGGYAMHGRGAEALGLFELMQHFGIRSNSVTLLCVLIACCHAGLVDKGQQYFNSMSECYNITPAMEHYGCMVDLFGRAGLLDEARDFINKMPIEPDATVWGCLLGACRIHNNIELGKWAAEQLFKLDPDNATVYVVLSNSYAAAGLWEDTENVRRMMKDKMIKKMPGRSWIEVNKQVHSFYANDRSHPQSHKIYAKLETLLREMKAAGYVPDTRFVFPGVEEEQKEQTLAHDSEKSRGWQ